MTKLVDIYMACLWRDGHVIKTTKSLLANKQLGTITIGCNNYTNKQWEFINKQLNYPNITLHRTNNEKGSCEKLRFITNSNNYYVAFTDDDLIYPPDYLDYLIKGCEKYNSIVSLHGRIMKKHKITNYYEGHKVMYKALGTVNNDVRVDIIGNGVSLFKRSFFDDLNKWYDYIEYPNMDDIYVSYFAKQKNIKQMVLKHLEGYLKHKEIKETDNYVFTKHRYNCQFQTNFINNKFNK